MLDHDQAGGTSIHLLKCSAPTCLNVILLCVGSPPWINAAQPNTFLCPWCDIVRCYSGHCDEIESGFIVTPNLCNCCFCDSCMCYDSNA